MYFAGKRENRRKAFYYPGQQLLISGHFSSVVSVCVCCARRFSCYSHDVIRIAISSPKRVHCFLYDSRLETALVRAQHDAIPYIIALAAQTARRSFIFLNFVFVGYWRSHFTHTKTSFKDHHVEFYTWRLKNFGSNELGLRICTTTLFLHRSFCDNFEPRVYFFFFRCKVHLWVELNRTNRRVKYFQHDFSTLWSAKMLYQTILQDFH